MTTLPFDPGNPPEQPPLACADPDSWLLAYRLLGQHRRVAKTELCTCAGVFPCPMAMSAVRTLLATCGIRSRVPLPVRVDWQEAG